MNNVVVYTHGFRSIYGIIINDIIVLEKSSSNGDCSHVWQRGDWSPESCLATFRLLLGHSNHLVTALERESYQRIFIVAK